MSDIMVQIGGMEGESSLTGFEGQIECLSMRHAIDLPVVAQGATRTEGASRHGAIELLHSFDKASPALRLGVSAGTNLGKVKITRMRIIGGESRPAEIISLNNVYVIRVDVDTMLDATTMEPSEEPTETFYLEYSDIRWDYKYYVDGTERGSVQGSWSNSVQSVNADV